MYIDNLNRVSRKIGPGKKGTGNNSTANNDPKGKVGKNGTFSTINFGVRFAFVVGV